MTPPGLTWEQGVWLAAFAAAWAVLHLVVAHRRDVGVVTLVAAGGSILVGAPQLGWQLALLVLAAALQAAAWARGARHGVGRPALAGAGLLVSVVVVCAHRALPLMSPAAPPDVFADVLVVPLALTGAVGFALALERPGPRRSRPRWFRRIPVEER